jgi:hypothetical protein
MNPLNNSQRNNPQINNSLKHFIEKYDSFCLNFSQKLNQSNIRKDEADKFYYIQIGDQFIKYTWNNIKDTHDRDLLIRINELRKIFVDSLIRIIEETKKDFCTQKRNTFLYCSVEALGSTALTSNYDVNISSFMAASDIVNLFNLYFFEFWNDTSGEIFDTNLYGNSFFITTFKNEELDRKYNKVVFGNRKSVYYLPPEEIDINLMRRILAMQTKWLIIKSFMYQEDNGALKIYDKIREIAIGLIRKLSNKQQNMNSNYEQMYNKMRMINNDQLPPNQFRNRVNQKYFECLKVSDGLREQYLLDSNFSNLSQLIDSISFSNFYGNETYFCIGTIYHILGYVQGLAQFKMYPEYFIQSMIENFLDIFRNFEYTKNVTGFFKSTKYIYRVYDAIGKFYSLVGIEYGNSKKVMFGNMLKQYKQNKNSVRFNHNRISQIYKLENLTTNGDLFNIYMLILRDIEDAVNHYLQLQL